MDNFEFYNPVKIIFGKGQMEKLPEQLPGKPKVMMVYGGGSIFKNGVYNQVTEALEGYKVVEFGGIEPNPRYATAMKAVKQAREEDVEWLLAVGGGSVIDATKFIAAAVRFEGEEPWDILAKGAKVENALPFGSVLTLPATGSEMNSGSVITREDTEEKLPFSSPHTFPKFSFLLPDAAATLPKRQVANGVVDAYTHVIEQYLTYPVNAPLQDRFAESILKTLIEEGPKAYANPGNYDAMSNLMWCATMALNGVIRCGMPGDWSVHGIGHELTAFHGIDHARTLAVVLPGLWHVLREEKKQKLVQYGQRVWDIEEGTEDEIVDRAIQCTVDFFESLGIKTRLADYNVPESTIDRIVSRFEERGITEFGDRRLVTPKVVRKVLEHRLN